MSDRATFLAAMDAAIPNVTTPDKDPVEFYLTRLRESSTDANKTYHHVRFGQAKIEDVRNYLVHVTARAWLAWVASFVPRKPRKEKDLVSTEEALAILKEVTGFEYTRQAISVMVRQTKELKVAGRQGSGRGGRPTNFFLRSDVLKVATKRVDNEGDCPFTGCKLKLGHRGHHQPKFKEAQP